ncbi:MFS transporter, partial [Streptococcus thoraltensis]
MMQPRKPWVVLGVLCGIASGAIGISFNTWGVFYSVVAEVLGRLVGFFSFPSPFFFLLDALIGLFS